MNKIVVYMGDRRLYSMMVTACKSLLMHSAVDHVYFLTDTPDFPSELPDIISCVNVHNQPYFRVPGPNYHSHYGYMTWMRAALSKVFPDEPVVLLLDPDTIVCNDISEIWHYDISDFYFAAVEETRCFDGPSIHHKKPYFNAGVMLMNLDKLRDTHIDDEIIRTINTTHYLHLEQDVLNFVCDKHILSLPSTYNYSFVSDVIPGEPCIRHFLSHAKPQWPVYATQYERLDWNTVMRKQSQLKAGEYHD